MKVSEGTGSTYNELQLVDRLVATFKQALGEENVVKVPPMMASEDFGNSVWTRRSGHHLLARRLRSGEGEGEGKPRRAPGLALGPLRSRPRAHSLHGRQGDDLRGAGIDEK